MKVELRQHFQIESARFLPNLPESHPCKRLHGHSFRITLRLQGSLDAKIGWLKDYHEIKKIVAPILAELDHRVLNEVPGLENPTSEKIAIYLFNKLNPLIEELVQIQISETMDTECSYPII